MLKTSFLILTALFVGQSVAAEWNHKKPGYDPTGAVTLRTATGLINHSNNAAFGLKSSASPTVLSVLQSSTDMFAVRYGQTWYRFSEGQGLVVSSMEDINKRYPAWVQRDLTPATSIYLFRRACSTTIGGTSACSAPELTRNVGNGALPMLISSNYTESYREGSTVDVVRIPIGSTSLNIRMAGDWKTSCLWGECSIANRINMSFLDSSQSAVISATGQGDSKAFSGNNNVGPNLTLGVQEFIVDGKRLLIANLGSQTYVYESSQGSWTVLVTNVSALLYEQTAGNFVIAHLPEVSSGSVSFAGSFPP